MRALLQRVRSGQVTVAGDIVGQIDKGFVILLGITHTDTPAQAEWLANKISGLRLFEDAEGKMNLGLDEISGQVLAVSQFTLYGEVKRGKRPSFSHAARPEQAEPLYEHFVTTLRQKGIHVETGIFGAMMQVDIHNDGPVTLLLEKDAHES